ncbi:MAG: YccF domain-containing protein [Solirubrobacterales bacterium]
MRIALNIIWLVLAGFWSAIAWCLAGIVMCILIITIPFGLQAFKIASFTIWPFGRTLVKRPEAGAASAIGNILWFVLAGWWLAGMHLISSFLLAITIIGIPLAMANLKLVMVSLLPFGREIVPIDQVGTRQAEGIDFGSF